MLLSNIPFIILFLTTLFETATCNDVNSKIANEEQKWNEKCRCPNDTNILMQQDLPIRCACISNDYDKRHSPRGGRSNNTVKNTFQDIKVLDVNEAEKKIDAYIKLYFRWQDNRISTNFPNNESKILISVVSPSDSSLSIWTPDRSPKGRILRDKWKFFFVNSFWNNNTVVEGVVSGKFRSLCDFNFTKFPFDRNECQFRISSKLQEELREILDQRNQRNHYLMPTVVSAFDVSITLFGNAINETNQVRNDFGFTVEVKRRILSYIIQYYLPCASIVAISSISFIIPVTAIPGRVSLVVTLFLTLSNLIIHHEVSFSTPQNKLVYYKRIIILYNSNL